MSKSRRTRVSLTQAEGCLVLLVCSSQLSHQVGAVVAGVVGDDGGKLEEKSDAEMNPRLKDNMTNGTIRRCLMKENQLKLQTNEATGVLPSSEPWQRTPWRPPPSQASYWPDRSPPWPSASQSSLTRQQVSRSVTYGEWIVPSNRQYKSGRCVYLLRRRFVVPSQSAPTHTARHAASVLPRPESAESLRAGRWCTPHLWTGQVKGQSLTAVHLPVCMCACVCVPKATPEKWMSMSSPIITSSISLQ